MMMIYMIRWDLYRHHLEY